MYACISGRLDLVKMLVIKHADVAAVDCVSIYYIDYLPMYVEYIIIEYGSTLYIGMAPKK